MYQTIDMRFKKLRFMTFFIKNLLGYLLILYILKKSEISYLDDQDSKQDQAI